MTRFTTLFEKGRIGSMEVKNRTVMAPMGTLSADEGFVTDKTIDYYVARAKGGVGLIITQGTAVSQKAPGGKEFMALWDDKFIPGVQELADAVHQYGTKIAIQLGHHGLQHSDPGRMLGYGSAEIEIVGPSPVVYLPTGMMPKELTKEGINELVEAFSEAARRTKTAGCDAVEFHGAHGRLINQFLSPYYNRRTDEYGGTAEKRTRFACEIIRRTREKVGPDFSILIRINGDDDFVGGTTIEEAARQALYLVEAGADCIDVSCGVQEFASRLIATWVHPPGLIVHLAEAIKKVVNVPVITVGRLHAALANKILEEGRADFVAFGRPLLADPELVNKAEQGRVGDTRMCIACNNCMQSLTDHLFRGQEISGRALRCTINPTLFREKDFAIEPTASPKNVMVIGGGLAGMQAALFAAQRGHVVSLFEKTGKLGGQWNVASATKWTRHYGAVAKQLRRDLEKAGVAVVLNTEITLDLVREKKPDVAVVATGAIPTVPDLPGIDGANTVQANDVLLGTVNCGDRIVIIGGSGYDTQIAYFIANQGKQVFLVTEQQVGEGMEAFAFRSLKDSLVKLGAHFYTNYKPIDIREDGITIYGPLGLVSLKADTVVLALSPKPEKRLMEVLKKEVPELYSIGDCVEPRSALDALEEGADVGIKV
jgi:2,4-dienoyl-CoA reductase (NADPH2)